MVMDPDKLAAFATNGGPPPGGDESADADAGGDDTGDDNDPGQFGQLLTLLENNADDVMSLTDEFDPDELTDESTELDDGEKQTLLEGVQSLDQALQGELAKLTGISLDDAQNLAQHLESEGVVDDAERLGGWLFRVGQIDLSGGDDSEDSDDTEDSDDSGDDAGGDDADADAGGDGGEY